MTDVEALLKAILADPDDNTVRLIYADAIEETQPERAEFIRVQIELASFPLEVGSLRQNDNLGLVLEGGIDTTFRWMGKPVTTEQIERFLRLGTFLKREAELIIGSPDKSWGANASVSDMLSKSGCWWAYRGNDPKWQFSRGFADHFTMQWRSWQTLSPAILADHPVRKVTLTTPAFRHWNHDMGGRVLHGSTILTKEELEEMWKGIEFETSGDGVFFMSAVGDPSNFDYAAVAADPEPIYEPPLNTE